MDFVMDNIAIGHSVDARNVEELKKQGITTVLNVAFDLEINYQNESELEYYKVGLVDGPGNEPSMLFAAFCCLFALLEKHKRVLVHCHSGVSRSATVVALYKAVKQDITLNEAIEEIRREREIDPHEALRDLATAVRENCEKTWNRIRTSQGRGDKLTNESPLTIYAFDRDLTITVNKGKVPLCWVRTLAKQPNTKVYATGNQALKKEAGIPGTAEIKETLQIDGRMARRERVDALRQIYPNAKKYIVVDDVDLSDIDGWYYYKPEEFYRKYKDEFRTERRKEN